MLKIIIKEIKGKKTNVNLELVTKLLGVFKIKTILFRTIKATCNNYLTVLSFSVHQSVSEASSKPCQISKMLLRCLRVLSIPLYMFNLNVISQISKILESQGSLQIEKLGKLPSHKSQLLNDFDMKPTSECLLDCLLKQHADKQIDFLQPLTFGDECG